MNHRAAPIERAETRLAWLLVAPAVAVILLVSLVPIAVTAWEALHVHDLRLPWLGTAVHRCRELHGGGQRSAFRCGAVSYRGVCPDQRAARADAWSCARGDDAFRRAGPGVHPRLRAAALGDSDGRGGAAVAVHVRSPDRHPGGVVSDVRAGRPCFRLVCAPARGLGTDHCRRRVEDHALRGDPAPGGPADDRPGTRRSGADRRREPGQGVPHNHAAAPHARRSSSPRHFGCSMRCGCSIWRT